VEYLVRFICSPRKWRFFKQPMNLVDFCAIIPFILDLVIGGLQVPYRAPPPYTLK
jgi:potassium voltage-gated channel Shab-related subfamily B protein 1